MALSEAGFLRLETYLLTRKQISGEHPKGTAKPGLSILRVGRKSQAAGLGLSTTSQPS